MTEFIFLLCFMKVYQKSADKKNNQIPNQRLEEISNHGAESKLKLFKGIYNLTKSYYVLICPMYSTYFRAL